MEEADLPALAGEFNAILGFMEQLGEVDVDGRRADDRGHADAAAAARGRGDRRRHAAKMLANAPDARDGFFAVPKVVE